MSRGNGRQRIFYDESDYQRLWQGLAQTLDRFGFEIASVACMPNHIHVFSRAPEPNLSRGMQYSLSGYANWFSTRHRRPGHLLQGRFQGELIEDESYFWTGSRANQKGHSGLPLIIAVDEDIRGHGRRGWARMRGRPISLLRRADGGRALLLPGGWRGLAAGSAPEPRPLPGRLPSEVRAFPRAIESAPSKHALAG